MIFDIERVLTGYTEKRIKEELDVDEVIKKFVMVKNWEHTEAQAKSALMFYYHPNRSKDDNYPYIDLPFPETKNKEEKNKKFDRDEAWERAPTYDLNMLKNTLPQTS